MEHFLIAIGFFFGALIGSFLNVCIYRIPRGISVASPARSFCPNCKHSIPWDKNIPILSWFLLRGRCAYCHERISSRYAVVETLTAMLFATAAFLVPLPTLLSVWVILSILVVATFVDLEFMIIPDSMSKGGIAAGLILAFLTPGLHKTSSRLFAVRLLPCGSRSWRRHSLPDRRIRQTGLRPIQIDSGCPDSVQLRSSARRRTPNRD